MYAALVFVVSVIPVATPGPPGAHLDKVAHLCEYLLLAWLLVHAVRSSEGAARPLWWAWIWATGYGALIELVQAFIPWRSAELGDAIANALGAAVGLWIARRFPWPSQQTSRC